MFTWLQLGWASSSAEACRPRVTYICTLGVDMLDTYSISNYTTYTCAAMHSHAYQYMWRWGQVACVCILYAHGSGSPHVQYNVQCKRSISLIPLQCIGIQYICSILTRIETNVDNHV